MPTLYDIKPRFQALLRPLVRRLAGAGVTANQITLLAAAMSVLVGAGVAWRPDTVLLWLLIPATLFVRMALNAIDGMLAREHAMKSPLGAMLNEIGDVVADAALYLPFALLPSLSPALVVGIVILAGVSEMTGVVAVQIGASRRYDGPLGKSDRALLFGLLALLAGLGVTLQTWGNVVLGVALVLLILTILNRGRQALAEVRAARAHG
ncbi:MAG: CDP-alcohol phosphatidyltransferase family protein [Opitutaceae bacterium]|nr:CDP-alcohol phosphatidyltransferase family protein [Opitutaceae bacterium]